MVVWTPTRRHDDISTFFSLLLKTVYIHIHVPNDFLLNQQLPKARLDNVIYDVIIIIINNYII